MYCPSIRSLVLPTTPTRSVPPFFPAAAATVVAVAAVVAVVSPVAVVAPVVVPVLLAVVAADGLSSPPHATSTVAAPAPTSS